MNEVEKKQDTSLSSLIKLSHEIKFKLTESFGEITDDIQKALSDLEQKLPNKADGYKFIIDDLQNESALWKKRAQDFSTIAKSFDVFADSMKKRILLACQELQVDEIMGNEYRWKLQKAKPTVIIDDEEKIPSGHKILVQTTQIRKDGILSDLQMGLPVPGCHLEESIFVRCYVNTARKEKK